MQEAKYSIGATWADYDQDGDMDVFVPATNSGSNSLYRNDGNGNFVKMTNVGIAADNLNSVGSSWGDYDNDGDLDLFVANTSGQNNLLYNNQGNGTFQQVTTGIVVNDGGHSSGSNWIDLDNDGDLDLYVCNDQNDKNALYTNQGNGTFVKSVNPLSENHGNSYAQAWADYDNDGDLDVLIGNHSGETNVFFENGRASCNSWACIKLEGTQSNASAIGAKVRVKATIYGNATWQMREISGQTGGGASSQSTLRAMFGLGDAAQIDSLIIEWPSGSTEYFVNQSINTCHDVVEQSGVQVCGTVYYDVNQNCIQDSNEIGIPGIQIRISPGPSFVMTDENGHYETMLTAGNYVLTQKSNGNWTQVCPSNPTSYSLQVNAGQSYCGNDFANQPTCALPDLNVNLGTTALRKGFQNHYSIQYENKGAHDAYNAIMKLEVSNDIVPLSADVAWSTIEYKDTTTLITWNLDTVPAMQRFSILLTDSVSRLATIGSYLTARLTIVSTSTDCDTADNVALDINEVVGAVDPNDITVYPKGAGQDGFVKKTTDLTYKIRFQNTGNYMAQHVNITDQLPEHLDVSSIRNITASHPFQFEISNQEVHVRFLNIELPDSNTSEINSHGFVSFMINPINEVPEGERILNQAKIVFDYEDAVPTNIVKNRIKFDASLLQNNLLIQPNPVDTWTELSLVLDANQFDEPPLIQAVKVSTINGRVVLEKSGMGEGQTVRLDCSDIIAGVYLIEATDQHQQTYRGKLIVK